MPIKTVFIVGTDSSVLKMFKMRGFKMAESEEEADAVCFTGGSDIYPFLYGESPLDKGCFYNLKRDKREIRIFKSLPKKQPKIGICRGAQLFNILCGGAMYQDVNNHNNGKTHPIKDHVSGKIIECTSVHHQMMIPGEDAFLIASAQESSRKESERLTIQINEETRTRNWDDPEVIYYSSHNALCFQGHPENGGKDLEPMRDYFFDLIKTYLANQG